MVHRFISFSAASYIKFLTLILPESATVYPLGYLMLALIRGFMVSVKEIYSSLVIVYTCKRNQN